MINLLPRTRTALLVDGDALLAVRARYGVTGVTHSTLARIEGFLDAPIDTCRAALREVAGERSGETVLVVPGAWCPSRPVPITSKSWADAHEARRELVEAYFPFAASDCEAGVLDLTGEEGVVGKSVQKDQEKGKLTLPLIRHLEPMTASGRDDEARSAFQAAGDPERQAELIARLREDGSIASAAATARELVDRAQGRLSGLAETPARGLLAKMGEAAVARAF